MGTKNHDYCHGMPFNLSYSKKLYFITRIALIFDFMEFLIFCLSLTTRMICSHEEFLTAVMCFDFCYSHNIYCEASPCASRRKKGRIFVIERHALNMKKRTFCIQWKNFVLLLCAKCRKESNYWRIIFGCVINRRKTIKNWHWVKVYLWKVCLMALFISHLTKFLLLSRS